MKKTITALFFLSFVTISNAQQASDYFPDQTGFEWKFKQTPLDSANNPIPSLAQFRVDSFATVTNYQGRLANIVNTKDGPLNTILLQPYLDSLFYNTEGTDGYEYFSIRNIAGFLISLDSAGIAGNFSFLDFFTSLQDWYSTYRFTSNINSEYTLLEIDTTITVNSLNVPFTFKYSGTRLNDETIQTVLGTFDCKKFLLQWNITAYSFFNLLTLNDTIWIAPDNWIVQDIIPGQYVDISILPVPPFSIIGLETKLTNEIVVSVGNEESSSNNFSLEQNYPNPFNPSTKISWQSPVGSWQTLKVYDVLGNEVATLVDEYRSAGTYEVEFNTSTINHHPSSGIYFYKLETGSFIETKKMILIK